MTDRRNEGRGADLRRLLVKAGRDEHASTALRASLAAMVSIPLAVAHPISIVTRVARPPAPPPPPPPSVSAAAAGTTSVTSTASTAAVVSGAIATTKVLAVVAVLVGVAGAVAAAAIVARAPVTDAPSPRFAEATPPPSASATSGRAAPPVRPSSEIVTIPVHDLPSAPRAPTSAVANANAKQAAAPTDAAPEPTPPPARDLTAEIHAIEAMRAAANSGRSADALALADAYAAQYPGGVLVEEAEVLRIESLARLGRRDEASGLARRFRERRPTSPYAARVRPFDKE